MARRIIVTGVKKSEISTEDLANIFYLQAKRRLADRRASEAKAKAKRAKRDARNENDAQEPSKDKDSGGRS